MKELLQRLWLLSRKTIIKAIAGFVFWTIALTPYMLFVVKMSWKQYWTWILGSQLILSPFLSAASAWCMDRAVKIFIPKSKKEMKWPE